MKALSIFRLSFFIKGCGLAFAFFLASCGSAGPGDLEEPPDMPPPLSQEENRSLSGLANNLNNVRWGSAGTFLIRIANSDYSDSTESMTDSEVPNPRVISNALCDQGQSLPDSRGLSAFVFQWGQFIDHDMDLSHTNEEEPVHISVPEGDDYFDPEATGLASIPFFRSVYDESTGSSPQNPRQQLNSITAYIDASNIYGSNEELAKKLRTFRNGKLKTSEHNLLPFEHQVYVDREESFNFISGDERVNEQVGLTSMHTLFMREHNRLCEVLKLQHPNWDDERLYQRARKIVGALLQVITYQEFLPALLGEGSMGPYLGYDPHLNPGIINCFATAFYRVGHTMVPEQLLRLKEDGSPLEEGPLPLKEAFFASQRILNEGGIEPVLRGLAEQENQKTDIKLVEALRNFLFGEPGEGGMDLAALNIQRGRDHGLPSYNILRKALGLSPVTRFEQMTSDPDLAIKLEELYGSVDQVDPWVGALAEDSLPGSSVGPCIWSALVLQFNNLRHGDRFWYENDPAFSLQTIETLKATTLSDVIRRNTDIENIPDNVFFVE